MPHARPLSPHLDIYRWRVNMIQSTLHRLTGLFLCLGTLLLTWGLVAAAADPPAWAVFATFCSSWIGLLVLVAGSWSLLFHLCNGIQHLVHDSARNFGPPVRDRRFKPVYWATGWAVIGASLVLTSLVWALLAWRMAGGSA